MDDREGVPRVRIPERLDRPLRLGPFSGGREAIRFLAAAAIGTLVSLAVAPWAGVPVIGAGAIVALWRPNGEGLDERIVAWARWAARRAPRGDRLIPPPGGSVEAGRTTLELPDGRSAVLLRAGGCPLSFLPPAELARHFDRYRELLQASDGGLIMAASAAPIHAESVLPDGQATSEQEQEAQEGYRELVALLARRRSVRVVLLALVQDSTAADDGRRLATAGRLLAERLADLGIRVEPLQGAALAHAARRIGLLPRLGRP